MDQINQFEWAELASRMGPLQAKQRLGLEIMREAEMARKGAKFLEFQNWSWTPSIIRVLLKLSGMYWRGLRNAQEIMLRRNELHLDGLPTSFEGFTILQLSDLHVEMSEVAMQAVCQHVRLLDYDICVITGDFRAGTHGSFQSALKAMAEVRQALRDTVFGVLGNHDTIRMVPALEAMGIRMLLNEGESISRNDQEIFIAGIDDAHWYRAHNLEKAVSQMPENAFSVLLSHTPEVYQQAAQAGFKLLLSGHTHGGQICLPGGIPITLDAVLPRPMGAGAWQYGSLQGYTSVGAGTCIVPVRFNCPPEITLHVLRQSPGASMVRHEYESSGAVEK